MSTRTVIAKRFEIADPERDLLGQGGMGDVYRGTDLQTGQAVAIKVLKPESVASDPDVVARFLREGEALRQLDHHNIVNVVDAIEEDRRHYLVMEYVPGGSLRDLLEAEGQLPIERTVEIALDVADALTRAHRLGIVHRDLKPANVLLAEDGTPRLSDFGLAQVVGRSRLTQTGTVIGTILYLSPEACEGKALDTRADIWSFGAMLYEMLTGEPPFVGDTLAVAFAAILTRPVPDLSKLRPDVPDALADLVYRMLEKDRAARIPSVRLVGAELEAILEGGKSQVKGFRFQVGSGEQSLPTTSRFVTPTPPTEARHNLPVQVTPFVGREAELAELDRLLADPGVHLVTVLGTGGMGKTRLALEAATRQVNRYAHGIYFVSLAPLRSVDAIVPTIAEALGYTFYEGADPKQQLLNYLRQKEMLLLLDNYEHLHDGVEIASDILAAAPDVSILATSRIRLNVRGENLFPLAGMEFPETTSLAAPETARESPKGALEYSAVKLFMQSARRVRPGFDLEADDLKYVTRICRLVGGMPLGILIAAAWIEILTPAEVVAEIRQNLDFLETDLHDAPARQRSIRAVFDHSWVLLTAREQAVFAGLSVFRGGFTREAAQQVTSISLRELMSLVNKSLLNRAPTGRYEIHELLRQYAAERLRAEKLDSSAADGKAVRDRHTAYYAAALQRWGEELKGPRQQAALAEIEVDIENARAAWDWAVERRAVAQLDQAMEGLCLFYERRFRLQEGDAVCRAAVGILEAVVSGLGQRVRARALTWQAFFVLYLGDRDSAEQLVQQSLAILDSPGLADQVTGPEEAFCLWVMGKTVFYTEPDQARRLAERSLALYRSVGDRWGIASLLEDLGWGAWQAGDYDEVQAFSEESLAIQRTLGDRSRVARSLMLLGLAAAGQGYLKEARHLAQESLAISQEIDDSLVIGQAFYLLGSVALAEAERLRGVPRQGKTGGTASHLREAYAEAQRLLQESVAAAQEIERQDVLNWALAVLGLAARELGQPSQAQHHFCKALHAAIELVSGPHLMVPLSGIALLLADRGQPERAIELYALVSHYPLVANSRWFEDVAGRHIAAIATPLPPDAVAAAQERGRARDLWATAEELWAELGDRQDAEHVGIPSE